MWLDSLLASRNDLGAVCSESAFASARSDDNDFPRVINVEGPPIRYADVEHSQSRDVWDN